MEHMGHFFPIAIHFLLKDEEGEAPSFDGKFEDFKLNVKLYLLCSMFF